MAKKKIYVPLLLWLVVLWPWGRQVLAKEAEVTALLERAAECEDQQRYREAEALYKDILKDYPSGSYALAGQKGLVIVYNAWHKQAEAEAAFQELIDKFSEDDGIAKAIDHIADQHRQSGRYEAARELYKYIVARWPQAEHAAEAQRGAILASVKLGDDPNAEAGINKLLTDFAAHKGLVITLDSLGDAYRASGKPHRAQALYQYVVDHWPDSDRAAEAQAGVARACIQAGDQAAAEAAVARLLADFAASEHIAKAVWLVAGEYRFAEQHSKALELCRLVVENWPSSTAAIGAQASVAGLYILLGDDPNAAAAVDKLIGDYGQSEQIAGAVEKIAAQYSEMGNQDKASELYRYVVEHRPESERAIWAQMGLVMSRIRAWDLDGAEAELQGLLGGFGAHDDLAEVIHEIVEEYRNTGAHQAGRSVFGYLLENQSASETTILELQVGVALSNIKLGELDKADAAVSRLIADHKDHADLGKALFQIAEEYLYAGRHAKTIELLELILRDYGQMEFRARSELPFVLGTCYEHLQEYDKAIDYYKKTLEQYPDSKFAAQAAYMIGWIYAYGKKDYENGIYWYKRQRQLYPGARCSELALYRIEHMYTYKLRDYQAATEACEQYLQEYPEGQDLSRTLSNLGLCYEMLGDKQGALSVLRQAYEAGSDEGLRASIIGRISRLEKGGAK